MGKQRHPAKHTAWFGVCGSRRQHIHGRRRRIHHHRFRGGGVFTSRFAACPAWHSRVQRPLQRHTRRNCRTNYSSQLMPEQQVLLDSGAASLLLSEKAEHQLLKTVMQRELQGLTMVLCPIVEAELSPWLSGLGKRRGDVANRFFQPMLSYPITTETATFYSNSVWREIPTFSQNDRWIASVAMERNIHLATIDSDFVRATHLRDSLIYLDKNRFTN